jgi:hypothetical protein
MKREKLYRNIRGEYLYLFNFIDENGRPCGFNDIWAPNKRVAYQNSKKLYNRKAYQHEQFGWISAILVDFKTLRRSTRSQYHFQNKMGHMMTC